MSNSRSFAAFGVLTHGVVTSCLFLCGCERSERITVTTVAKHDSLQTAEFLADHARRHPDPERMIGVVIPRGDVMWFFKLQGNVDKVAARENEVREFLKTVRFPAAEEIDWTLPQNWLRLPRREMRYATLVMDGEPPLEISVTQLPMRRDMPTSEQVVANINRWRGQLSLPPIDDDDLTFATEKMIVADTPSFFMNIEGRPRPKPAAMTPPPQQQQAERTENRVAPKMPFFEKPDGWVEGGTGMATVAFQATDGNAKIVITVTAAGGSRVDNVNRWRGQIQLEPLPKDQVEASAKKVSVGPLTGEQFEMSNGTRTIFGVIVEDRGLTWYIKLDGDPALAERERGHFEAFLKSLKWND